MKAITLIQPWATCIADFGKRVENRTWMYPRAALSGKYIAIHAGKTMDAWVYAELVAEGTLPLMLHIPLGAVVAVCMLGGAVRRVEELPDPEQARWFCGPFGWLLTDVIPIEPVPCRGSQGFWDLPAEVEEAVHAACRERGQR